MNGVSEKKQTADEFFSSGFTLSYHRNLDESADVVKAISDDLMIPEADLKKNEDLRALMTDVCLTIIYYARKLKRAMLKRILYIGLSIILIVAVPLAVHFLSTIGGAGNNATYVAQLTAALTGVLGLQKAFSTWLSQSREYGRFWKALAELKEIYYSLRTKLRGRGLQNGTTQSLGDAHLADVKQAVVSARVVIRQEQDDFFNNLTIPNIDAAGSLSTVRAEAAALLGAFRAPSVAVREIAEKDIAQKRRDVVQIEAELKAIQDTIEQNEKKLTGPPPLQGSEKASIDSAIDALRKRRQERELELTGKRGALAAAMVVG